MVGLTACWFIGFLIKWLFGKLAAWLVDRFLTCWRLNWIVDWCIHGVCLVWFGLVGWFVNFLVG